MNEITRRSFIAGSLAAPIVRTSDNLIWTGVSAGVRWRWTDDDLTANGPHVRYSLANEIRRAVEKADDGGDTGLTEWEAHVTLLCVVGTIACCLREDYWEGGAHPSGGESFRAFDVRNPARDLKLTDLFRDADILNALLADPIIRKVRAQERLVDRPATSATLVKEIAWKEFDAADGNSYAIPETLLSQFALYSVSGDRVIVRLCLPHGSEISRFHHTQIGISLPTPPALRRPLTAASERRTGYLMCDASRIAHGRSTRIVIQARKR